MQGAVKISIAVCPTICILDDKIYVEITAMNHFTPKFISAILVFLCFGMTKTKENQTNNEL